MRNLVRKLLPLAFLAVLLGGCQDRAQHVNTDPHPTGTPSTTVWFGDSEKLGLPNTSALSGNQYNYQTPDFGLGDGGLVMRQYVIRWTCYPNPIGDASAGYDLTADLDTAASLGHDGALDLANVIFVSCAPGKPSSGVTDAFVPTHGQGQYVLTITAGGPWTLDVEPVS